MRRKLLTLVLLASTASVHADLDRPRDQPLDRSVVRCEQCFVPTRSVPVGRAPRDSVAVRASADFTVRHGAGWSILLSPNTGRPTYVGGQGIPLIPFPHLANFLTSPGPTG